MASERTTKDEEFFGDGFISRCFTTPNDLTQALSQAMPLLINTPSVMEQLDPTTQGQMLADTASNPYAAATRLATALSQPRRIELQRQVLSFMRSQKWLSYCLTTSTTPSNDLPPDAVGFATVQRIETHHAEACRLRDAQDLAGAAKKFEEEVLIRNILGQTREAEFAKAMVVRMQGRLAFNDKHFSNADSLFEQSRTAFASIHDDDEARTSRAWAVKSKARLAHNRGNHQVSLERWIEAKTLWEGLDGREAEVKTAEARILQMKGWIHHEHSEPKRARQKWAEEADAWEGLGNWEMARLARDRFRDK